MYSSADAGPALPRLPQLAEICDAGTPICPSCRKPIRRVRAVLGSVLATCDNRAPRPGPHSPTAQPQLRRRRENVCGQHVHILGAAEGVCIVVRLDADAFDQLVRGSLPAYSRDLYGRLGILP